MNMFGTLQSIIELKRKVRILENANTNLESELALEKEYNESSARCIKFLEDENKELVLKLKCRKPSLLFVVPKRQTFVKGFALPVIESREPVITDAMKVSIFDSLQEKGLIRKLRETDLDVIYEIKNE